MNILHLKNNKYSKKHLECPSHFTHYLIDHGYDIYSEDYFNSILYSERKRTERSNNPFLLMLLNVKKSFDNIDEREIIKKIVYAIYSSTREIDIKGWYKYPSYKYPSIIGIIFTETNGIGRNVFKDKMLLKIYNNLSNILNLNELKRIEISLDFFPEECNEENKKSTTNLTLYPDLLRKNPSKRFHLFSKRVLDIIGSIIGLLIFSPLFLITPLMIKLSSKGPVLFRQESVGLQGAKFTFLKFRSMYVNNDCDIHKEYIKSLIGKDKCVYIKGCIVEKDNIYKIKSDPRITPIGRFLRKTSLDEFPQFLNVLKGEMSLVGPRPPIPYELECYDIWHKRRILEIKPGITGIWQVKGRSTTTFDEMVRMDLKYIREWSPWLDIKILLQTPWVILTCKGAY